MVTQTADRLLTTEQTSDFLQVSESFLRQSRMEGKREGRTPGPPFVRIGRAVRYRLSDLDAWLSEHRVEVT